MKPSERARVATETVGDIVGAKIEPGQRIETYLLTEFQAAEREAFEAGWLVGWREAGGERFGFTPENAKNKAYEDWRRDEEEEEA